MDLKIRVCSEYRKAGRKRVSASACPHFISCTFYLACGSFDSGKSTLEGRVGRPHREGLKLEHLCQVSFCFYHRLLRGIWASHWALTANGKSLYSCLLMVSETDSWVLFVFLFLTSYCTSRVRSL